MASNGLRIMLQTAVQTVNWTYSLFWQLCPQRGILVWGDGYYNGAIKTRKTMLPMEVSTEEASLERSQQLRELYDNLTNHPTRPPSAALLSLEDLTETEWYYLMCVSFSFPPGVGLPGKAYAKRQHIWLTGANEIDSKVFTRAILAKSARVQTVVCIPILDGVVEFGTTERVREDPGFIEQVKKLLVEHNHQPQPQPQPQPRPLKQALSEHSSSSENPLLPNSPKIDKEEDQDEVEVEDEDEEKGEAKSDSAAETDGDSQPSHTVSVAKTPGEPNELIQADMSEDIQFGSPDDCSNNLDVEFHLLAVTQQRGGSFRDESTSCWQAKHHPLTPNIHPPVSESIQDYTHYSETISSILHQRSNQWFKLSSARSAFTTWTSTNSNQVPATSPSQWLLKYILFTVPILHTNSFTPQDDLAANHVIAERRRREKLNERFITLRSLVPFVTKMDKASILGDTIEYVKQLRKKIEDLETTNHTGTGKRKVRIVEDNITDRTKALPLESQSHLETQVEVSIIESDALVELQCPYREGLLLDVMQKLRDLRLEISTVQSSLNNGFFVTEMRATVKKKVTIMEAKRAIKQILLVD